MTALCPACGSENPEGFAFCGACGSPLDTAAVPSDAEERKLVSVLFCDLVGHTAASDQADPEDVRAQLRPYHQLLKREIERYGGTVEKFVGDAVMAVFGAPVAHEDDAERAVRSALRILEAVEELELEVRAAIATGEAVVSLQARPEQGEGIVAGDVVNTASRLQHEAPPGSLVVNEPAFRATRDAIEYEQLEPVALKGKAEPVPLWRALRARARFGVDAEAAPRTPFIGREHDVAALQNSFERMLQEGAAHLVTTVGEPGVGKTRLVSEFRSWIDERPERVRWRQGRCLPYGEGITFWALGEIVKAQAGIRESDGTEQASAKLATAVEAAVEEPADREWLLARLAPLVGAVPEGGTRVERSESFTAWRRFLEALAAQRPLVLAVEDLHWADSALLDFLEHLVEWSTGVPMLVVCTARPELFERHGAWGGGKRNWNTLSLSPLTAEETTRLVSALLARAVLPADTQAALLERSGGNPLYAEEFVRMLSDQGILTGSGELVSDGEIAVPESVQALIAARLDTLSPQRKALLHDAAVVGKVFWAGAVAAIGESDLASVEQGLHELVRKELVRPARMPSVEGEDEYSFWHFLVRDVAYGQIPRAARAQKHRAAAEWIEQMAGERVADHAELLAGHYLQALELARATRTKEDLGQLEESAGRFLVLAADRARALDVGRTRELYAQALDLRAPGHPERGSTLAKAGVSAREIGDYAEAERLLEEAIGECRRRGDVIGAAGAMVELRYVFWRRGATSRARAVLDEAIALLEPEPASRAHAEAYSARAFQLWTAGRSREAAAMADDALPLATTFKASPARIRALYARGLSRAETGDPRGTDDLWEAFRVALESGESDLAVTALDNVAHALWLAEGPELALSTSREGVELGERRGVTVSVLWCKAETVWQLFDLGHWDELLRIAGEIAAADAARGQIEMIATPYQAKVVLMRGDLEAAAPLVAYLLPQAREIGDLQILVPALTAAALLDHASGRTAEAVERIRELADITEARAAWYRGVHLPDLLRILAEAGELELAEALPPTATEVDTRTRRGVETARAIVAEARGDHETAEALYGGVAERWAGYGSVYEQAHALLARGRCLVALGRSDESTPHLEQAREIFGSLGARPLVREVEMLLGDAQARRPA